MRKNVIFIVDRSLICCYNLLYQYYIMKTHEIVTNTYELILNNVQGEETIANIIYTLLKINLISKSEAAFLSKKHGIAFPYFQ